MKIFLLKHGFFTFRERAAYELELAGKNCMQRMCENLGAEIAEGALPAGEKAVLYCVYPFLTAENFERYLAMHAGSLRFRGGYIERTGAAFRAAEDPDEGMFSLADYAAFSARAERESALVHLQRGALVEPGARVDVCARLGKGAVVRSGAEVRGASYIGEDAEICGGSVVENSTVGAGTRVVASVLTESRVGKRCSVGPFAVLRPGARVGDDCRIGDFVELKNARLGEGCKAAHLAYIGDADLGAGVNVGCGAVFVNYDGRRKHRTRVGDGAFLGSNCNVVAPVRIGEGCFVAAGTTLTRDLAAGDFCIGRSRETVKPGGAHRYLF